MIAIVDYGMGNLRSVANALAAIGADAQIVTQPEELKNAERLVLPGVGAFRDCIGNLRQHGFIEALREQVSTHGKPILGICLGLQMLGSRSYEDGEYEGLSLIAGEVRRLTPNDVSLRVPQIGWNNLKVNQSHPVLAGLPTEPDFYFVHSYQLCCDAPGTLVATCDYGGPVTAVVAQGNIVATQFHPEKSQDCGLKLLENFVRWKP